MAKVKGLHEFIAFTDQLANGIEEDAKQTVKEYTQKTVRDSKTLAPVDTGNLRNNIRDTYENGGLIGHVTSNSDYGLFVEFGTHKKSPQPHMFPSFDRNAPLFHTALKKSGGK